jgi:hypothetical protein
MPKPRDDGARSHLLSPGKCENLRWLHADHADDTY